jgi:predicted P-loop ATPase
VAWGASADEWARYSLEYGWTEDLLPVVCNPHATISPLSVLKKIGKTPSRYNGSGQVVGIKDWTQFKATHADIADWSRREDYGICLQTRTIRAIDIDIEETAEVAAIVELAQRHLGGTTMLRSRAGSQRVLLLLRMPGSLEKRVIRRASGIIELLADGQQCVIAGTHPSGGRYRLDAAELRTCTLEQLNALWVALGGDAPAGRASSGAVVGLAALAPPDDPVAAWLSARGWMLEDQGDRLLIRCPWSEDHTIDSGPTECVYYTGGSGGFALGHFKCLHAHCADRTDAQFLDAIGFAASVATDFPQASGTQEVMRTEGNSQHRKEGTVTPAPVSFGNGARPVQWSSPVPGQGLKRGKKGYLATLENVVRALDTPGFERALGFDTFRAQLVACDWGSLLVGAGEWVLVAEHELIELRRHLGELGFEPIRRELMRDAVELVARGRTFDSAREWILQQEWDGVPRVDRFLVDYAGAEDSAYVRAVSAYLWTGLAGRLWQPGVQADMVVVLQSPEQGRGKTRGIEALVPHRDYYCTVDLSRRDEDLARRMRGRMVWEINELRGLGSRDADAINTFISERDDTWVAKYHEFAVSAPRRGLFLATTNSDAFLESDDQARRWLPVRIGMIDPARVAAVRAQLWAEGLSRFWAGGVAWQDAERLAHLEHEQFRRVDLWQPELERWLAEQPGTEFTLNTVVQGIGLDIRKVGRPEEMRLSRVLKQLGLNKIRIMKKGRRNFIWQRN